MPHPTVAVTGSTGALGSQVARALSEQGFALRLPVRDVSRAPELPGSTAVPFSYGDDPATQAALEGVDTVLMVSATESPQRLGWHRSFVDSAVQAGVRHLVYTSFVGAAPECTFTYGRDHYATEQHIEASGLRYTFLRDNFYLDVFPHFVAADGVIRGPAGTGRVAAVARADVAQVAATVLANPDEHVGASYDLTGPQALTLAEIAATLTECGQPARYHAETVAEAYESRRQWPAEPWEYDAWVSTYTAIGAGELAEVSDAVQRVTGRAPLSLRDVLAGSTR